MLEGIVHMDIDLIKKQIKTYADKLDKIQKDMDKIELDFEKKVALKMCEESKYKQLIWGITSRKT